MKEQKVKNLVICSTLNQITNYLIIKKYKPKTLYNITFDKNAIKDFNNNVNPDEWDKWLAKEVTGKDKFENNIEILRSEIYSLTDIKNKIEDEIINKISKNEEILWHVTGGQRTIALAISELIKEKKRKKDKLLYIEGNTEKLIINNCKGELLTRGETYGKHDLSFKTVLRLVGFDTKNLYSTTVFKGTESLNDERTEEYNFYKKLYEIVKHESDKSKRKFLKFDFTDENKRTHYNDYFRNLLVKSNSFSTKEKRTEFIKLIFEELLKKHKNLKEIGYYKEDREEFNQSYPAGYIFEKLTAYKIYDLIKNNPKIVGMETSLKTYFKKGEENKSKKDNIIDEIDIILLTDTGKIVNFECKSGGMKGDNAKSHKFTTYRLAGVFGMPILLSPLYDEETNDDFKDEELKKQLQALQAAKAAELEVIAVDKIKERLEKLKITEKNN